MIDNIKESRQTIAKVLKKIEKKYYFLFVF